MSDPNRCVDYAPPPSVPPNHRGLFAALSAFIALTNVFVLILLSTDRINSLNPENLIAMGIGMSIVGLAFGVYASWRSGTRWLAVLGMTINGGAVGVVIAGLAVLLHTWLLGM